MRHHRRLFGALAASLLCAAVVSAGPALANTPTTTVDHYGWKSAAEYNAKWAATYGDIDGTATYQNNAVTVTAAPFTKGADSSVFDHLKYIRISTQSFPVPQDGSLEFGVDIDAHTLGTHPGRIIHGCYGPSFSYTSVNQPCDHPYAQPTIEGQQAGVVLNMVNFNSGQLFDWFVSSGHVFALIERLPSTVTGSAGVGLDRAYTQIIQEAAVKTGKHKVSIRYTRGPGVSAVDYFLDRRPFAHVDHVGVPLDKQGVPYTGTYPSLGNGEQLSIDSFSIGHGLFSLLDAFPFQHPDAPNLSVSIPLSERLFGQGAIGTWKRFTVTTKNK